jgi:hypothetical protein
MWLIDGNKVRGQKAGINGCKIQRLAERLYQFQYRLPLASD